MEVVFFGCFFVVCVFLLLFCLVLCFLPQSEFAVLFCICSTDFVKCGFDSLRAAYPQALEFYRYSSALVFSKSLYKLFLELFQIYIY